MYPTSGERSDIENASLRPKDSCRREGEREDGDVVFLPKMLGYGGNYIGRLSTDCAGALEAEELALGVARFDP
jgi:hypothetical protein